MKLLFNLEYRTVYGEMLMLNVLGEHGKPELHAMTTVDGLTWTLELKMDHSAPATLNYYYSVCRDGRVVRTEWTVVPHRLILNPVSVILVNDRWIDIPVDSYLYSSAFTECVASRLRSEGTLAPILITPTSRLLTLKVRAAQLSGHQRLALVGAPVYLGSWETGKALPMAEQQPNEWAISLDADRLPHNVEFKFVIVDDSKPSAVVWEEGDNRRLLMPEPTAESRVAVVEMQPAWFHVPQWKGAGTVIPVFSLRSEGSFGVGDFGDLKMMVDWCVKTGQRILQVLPINDTTFTHTWQDSYPYNAISIYALHPQFADLRQLPPIKDSTDQARFEALRQELNALPQIDYERVNEAKRNYLHIIFKQEWGSMQRTKAYKAFFDRNKDWLEPYAAFCVERDRSAEGPSYWYFVQYVLDTQMRTAHEYARHNGVILKGDIPIGISRDGVEAKVEPRYFNLDGQAGAPPDAFSEDGQNWGFPTYNWDVMLEDGCQWWVRRFRKMQEYFDAYRIDHVLGFFRIWEIPVPEKSGLYGQFQPSIPMTREEIEGRWHVPFRPEFYLEDHKQKDRWHPRINATKLEAFHRLPQDEQQRFWDMYNDYFYRRNNHFWYEEAMKKLPRLTQATRMLCCAEDLGMVPDCVPWVMNDLRILSLEIQSMPKDPSVRFGRLDRNPYRSVATISTHDMSTLRQWWDEDWERTQDYYNNEMHHEGPAPHPLTGSLAKEIVARHLWSPSMLCLLSLQDWLSIDEQLRLPDADAERINIPANPRHYWRYRMHLTIEQLLEADNYNREVALLVKQSGR